MGFLDKRKALFRQFPSVHLSWSYSKYNEILDDSKEYETMTKLCVNLLEERAGLQEILQLVGSDSLNEQEKFTLNFITLIEEIFVEQRFINHCSEVWFCSWDR